MSFVKQCRWAKFGHIDEDTLQLWDRGCRRTSSLQAVCDIYVLRSCALRGRCEHPLMKDLDRRLPSTLYFNAYQWSFCRGKGGPERSPRWTRHRGGGDGLAGRRNHKVHCSCEVEEFVGTRLSQDVRDTPIACGCYGLGVYAFMNDIGRRIPLILLIAMNSSRANRVIQILFRQSLCTRRYALFLVVYL